MNHADPASVVRRLWERLEARDWEAAAATLGDGFVCEWPQTGQRFRGSGNFISMNRAHPAPNWHISIQRLVASARDVAAEIVVTTDVGTDACVGFYEVREGVIERATEYWSEWSIAPIPDWRSAWTERM